MQAEFFQKQIERLRNVYQSGANDERVRLMWERFKDVEDRVFERAINYMISEYTAQSMPALSKFGEAVGFYGSGSSKSNQQPYKFRCPPCSDLGFGWVGHKIVKCSCDTGQAHSDERIAQEQANYDKGRKLFPSPFDKENPGKARLGSLFQPLPYDPTERISAPTSERKGGEG